MEMIDTSRSSCVAAAGYDPNKNQMTVRFKGGREYTFDKVPEHIFLNMINASSVGKYFHTNVKNFYSYKRVR